MALMRVCTLYFYRKFGRGHFVATEGVDDLSGRIVWAYVDLPLLDYSLSAACRSVIQILNVFGFFVSLDKSAAETLESLDFEYIGACYVQ